MTTQYTLTGEKLKFENGYTCLVSSKMTKKGLRYFRFSLGRYFPLSKQTINDNII